MPVGIPELLPDAFHICRKGHFSHSYPVLLFSGSRADIQADFVNIHNRILLIGYINNKIRYISLTLMSDAANVRNLLEKVSDCLYLTF